MGLQEAHHGRQHQGERDKRQVAGDKVKLRRDVHIGKLGLAAQLRGQHPGLQGLGAGGAFGLEGFDVRLFGIVAVVVIFVDCATIAHPGVGGLGLGVVVLFFLPAFREHFFARILQVLGAHVAGVQALHTHHPRIAAQAFVQLALAHIHANDLRRTGLQQAVGKTAGALAHIQAAQAGDLQAGGGQCALQLQAATRDVFGLVQVQQLQLGPDGDVVAVFLHFFPGQQGRIAPLHARGNQPLCLGTGTGMAVIDQKNICTHKGGRKKKKNCYFFDSCLRRQINII